MHKYFIELVNSSINKDNYSIDILVVCSNEEAKQLVDALPFACYEKAQHSIIRVDGAFIKVITPHEGEDLVKCQQVWDTSCAPRYKCIVVNGGILDHKDNPVGYLLSRCVGDFHYLS